MNSRRSSNAPQLPLRFIKTLRVRLRLLWGTPRRLFWNVCRPGYVRANVARREGACRRCGACCRLVWQCPYLRYDNGLPSCRIYHQFRPLNCSMFPIDHRDLADRDKVASQPCGFSWSRTEKAPKASHKPIAKPPS